MNVLRPDETATPASPWRDARTWALLGVALVVYLIQIWRNSFWDFGHDTRDHLFYIAFIEKNLRLPRPFDGHETYHMPLYYIVSAGFLALGDGLHLAQPFQLVRLVSLICWFVYITFCVRLLREFVAPSLGFYMALALLLFTPMAAVSATQILNETPLTMAQLAGFYFLYRWWNGAGDGALRNSLIWNGLAIAFKTSGLILTGLTALLVAVKVARKEVELKALATKRVAVGLGLFVLTSAPPLLRNLYYYRIAEDRPESLMISNAPNRLNSQLPPHPLYYFFGFDLDSFLRHPFLDGYRYSTEWIWNMTLKSGMLTKHDWRSPELGTALNVLELLLIAFLLFAALRMHGVRLEPRAIPLVAFFVIQVVALMVFRGLYWHPATSDYRYIYSATAMVAVFFAWAIDWMTASGMRASAWVGSAMAIATAVCGVGLVLDQAFG